MTDILLAGLMAEVLPQCLPHARSIDVQVKDVDVQFDVFGMPILTSQMGANSVFKRLSRLTADDLSLLARIEAAYDLAMLDIQAEWDGQERFVKAMSSTRSAQDVTSIAKDVFNAVIASASTGLARSVVIGANYRLAAFELAQGDHRAFAYTHKAAAKDIQELEIKPLYTGFYSMERLHYRHKTFGGELSGVVTRDMLTSGDAAVVLPYDPVRDELVLIEQMRPAALTRGSTDAWGLEAVAGVIGYGETPEYTAAREIEEEAGLEAKSLYPLAPCYQSPGAISQFMYMFVAHVDLADYQPGIFGLDDENEDIRTHVLSRKDAVQLLKTHEANNAPLQLLLYALALDYEEIREALLAMDQKHA